MILSSKTRQILESNLPVNVKVREIEKQTRYYTETFSDRRMRDKIHICNNYMNELGLQGTMRAEAVFMIQYEFKDLKFLSKNCSKEQIIALIIFYVMKTYNIQLHIEKYSFFKRLKLTNKHYSTFVTKISEHYRKKTKI